MDWPHLLALFVLGLLGSPSAFYCSPNNGMSVIRRQSVAQLSVDEDTNHHVSFLTDILKRVRNASSFGSNGCRERPSNRPLCLASFDGSDKFHARQPADFDSNLGSRPEEPNAPDDQEAGKHKASNPPTRSCHIQSPLAERPRSAARPTAMTSCLGRPWMSSPLQRSSPIRMLPGPA
jgi:hypothetical protein